MNGIVQGVLIATGGLVVFGASVVGLLAATDRLDAEGVKDIPVLNQLIKPDADELLAAEEKKKAEQKKAARAVNASFKPDPQDEAKKRLEKQSKAVAQRKMFSFQSFAAPTTEGEIARLQADLAKSVKRSKLQTASLEKQAFDLELREQDLATRRESVQSLMDEVTRRIEELRTMRQRFEQDVTVLKANEKKNIKRQAEQLGVMEPQNAADLILELGLEKQDLAVKLLVSMEVEAASQIIALVDPKRGARLIEHATRVLQRD